VLVLSWTTQPIGSLLQTIVWSQQRAEVKQAKLIGVTSVAEVDGGMWSRANKDEASFEIETNLAQQE
jgi:hypothetical protein